MVPVAWVSQSVYRLAENGKFEKHLWPKHSKPEVSRLIVHPWLQIKSVARHAKVLNHLFLVIIMSATDHSLKFAYVGLGEMGIPMVRF